MDIALYNIEPKINNTALMQISQYHKNQGHNVEWYFDLKRYSYDKIYCSSLFDFTDKQFVPTEAIKGGTGYDICSKLPEEIQNTDLDYSIYPDCDRSYIWFSKGCIRNCPFCIVRKKEGYIYPVEPKNPVISRVEIHSDLVDDYVPVIFDIRSQVEYSSNIAFYIKIDSFNYSELTIYPSYQFYSINLATNQSEVSGTFGEFEQNETVVFCWVTINISQTRHFKSPISVFIVNTDLNSNKFRLSHETSFFGFQGVILTLMGQLLWFKFLSRKKKN